MSLFEGICSIGFRPKNIVTGEVIGNFSVGIYKSKEYKEFDVIPLSLSNSDDKVGGARFKLVGTNNGEKYCTDDDHPDTVCVIIDESHSVEITAEWGVDVNGDMTGYFYLYLND